MSFKEKFEMKKQSYTGEIVKDWLQLAFESGHQNLFNALKEEFVKHNLYEADAILREFDITQNPTDNE